MNPARRAIEKKARKYPSQEELLEALLHQLRRRKPTFLCHRVKNEVRIDMNGTTVGYVRVDPASDNVGGVSFKIKKQYGGLAIPAFFSKPGQDERKKMAAVCSFLMYLFDDRPSEERAKSRAYRYSDATNWYESFTNGLTGELTEAYSLYKAVTEECRYLIDVFHEIDRSIKSARGEDVAEAIVRVKKELPFLVKNVSPEDWAALYNEVVVDAVHDL